MAEPHVLARREFNEQFLQETGSINARRERHGEGPRAYTWFLRGVKEGTDCARVDMILVTEGMYSCARRVEMERWGGMACKSDHGIMWIEIDGWASPEEHVEQI
jgi:exonuclease III